MAWDSLCSRDLLRPKIRSGSSRTAGRQSSAETPTLDELRRLLWTRTRPMGHVDEVWPNLYVGDLYVARDKAQLSRMGISHVVNAAAGRFRIDTGPKFYKDLLVDYYGVEAEDNPNFDLSIYFHPVARYIRAALNSPRGARATTVSVNAAFPGCGPAAPRESEPRCWDGASGLMQRSATKTTAASPHGADTLQVLLKRGVSWWVRCRLTHLQLLLSNKGLSL
ncbi:dual specificity protein phosphatase 13B-like isoform 1-T2 [Rhynochetos jubatus]